MDSFLDKEFVVFDVETTGLSPKGGDRMVEIAALKVKSGLTIDRFHSLLNPQREISWGAYLVNGISQEMVADAPLARDVLPDFVEFIAEGCLVGHNVSFDLGFLRHELSLLDRQLKEDLVILDTLKISRILLPYLGSHRLGVVARELGVEYQQQHRAMADVQMTTEVLLRLMDLSKDDQSQHEKIFAKV